MPKPELPTVTDRAFTPRGDCGYLLVLKPADITFEADRIHRHHDELHGELSIRVNGTLPQARHFDGILASGAFNFSSTQARSRHAKFLGERSGASALDWQGFLDEFCVRIHEAERTGRPAIALADVPEHRDDGDSWTVSGFPLLKRLPTVVFGSGAAGKSYFAMWLAGRLAESGTRVLYADWEFNEADHRYRFGRLFPALPRGIVYAHCARPMVYEADRLSRLVSEHRCEYAVCDSMGFALNGPADEDQARQYYQAVRLLRIGTLHIAHTSRAETEDKAVFGSSFFENGARSIWFIQRADRNPEGELHFGLFNRKSNTTALRAPHGFKIVFGSEGTTLEDINVEDNDELAIRLPQVERVCRVLKYGPKPFAAIAELSGLKLPALKALMLKHRSLFTKIDSKPPKYGLASKATDEESF